MKRLFFVLFASACSGVYGQTDIVEKYNKASALLMAGDYSNAYPIFKDIESRCDKKDTIYSHILWYYTNTVSEIEKNWRMQEKFDSALVYGLEALQLIE